VSSISLYIFGLIWCTVREICLILQNWLANILRLNSDLTWFVSSSISLKRFDLESVLWKKSFKVNKSEPSQRITLSSKQKKILLENKVSLIYKLSFLIISPFFNFSCSSYVCLSIKDTRVIGLLFILDEYLFVTLSYISLISSWRFIRLGTKIEEERKKKKRSSMSNQRSLSLMCHRKNVVKI
jgi:hypothetical protein